MTLQLLHLNFLIYEENFISFLSVWHWTFNYLYISFLHCAEWTTMICTNTVGDDWYISIVNN
jgi:hypothetical protein